MAKKTKDASVKIHRIPIMEAIPNPQNPRKISDQRIDELCKSMKDLPEMIGYRFLVIDRETGHILGGNQRWLAAKKLGWSEIWVAYSDEMDEEQKKEFIIRDNIESGEWDNEKLDMDFKDFPLVEWGIKPSELEEAEDREQDKNTVKDAKVIYDNAEIKQIVVFYDAETHANILRKMEIIKTENYFGDNAEVLLFLIENYAK